MKPKTVFFALLALVSLSISACSNASVPKPLRPMILSFTATPATVPARGGQVTLNWSIENANKVVITPGEGEVTGNSVTVSIMDSTTFTLTASNDKEQVSKSITVNVAGTTPDTTAPTVISSTPANGATGITKDTRIVITFSEKMDQIATEAAYQSADLPASVVTFAWNNEGTELTINPAIPLSYASGTSTTIAAKTYTFRFSPMATDSSGNALATFNTSFSTLKAITARFTSQESLDGVVTQAGFVNTSDATLVVGDNTANVAMRGFLSFDLGSILNDAVDIERAMLSFYKLGFRGSPYSELDDCIPSYSIVGATLKLDHVNYGSTLTAEDFSSPSLADLGSVDNTFSAVSGLVSIAVTSAVKNDLDNHLERRNRSQYRLRFPLATNSDGIEDDVSFNTANSPTNPPVLEVDYLIP